LSAWDGTVFGAQKDGIEDQGYCVIEFDKHHIKIAQHLGLQIKHVGDTQRRLLVVRVAAIVIERRIGHALCGRGMAFGRLRNNFCHFYLQSIKCCGHFHKLGLGIEGLLRRTVRWRGDVVVMLLHHFDGCADSSKLQLIWEGSCVPFQIGWVRRRCRLGFAVVVIMFEGIDNGIR